jgi:hypothetical protein
MGARVRLGHLLVVAVTACCSRQAPEKPATAYLQAPSGPSAELVTTTAGPPTLAPATSADVSAALPPRSIPLRRNRPASDTPPAAGLDLLGGSLPGPRYPSGTSFVVELADDDAVHVAEWDLATRTALHEARLDVPSWGLQLLKGPGPSVRLLANAYNGPLLFVQLTGSLDVAARREVGRVSVMGPNGFAGDETLTVVLAHGEADVARRRNAESGIFATSFDASGDQLAKRLLERDVEDGGTSSPMMSDNLAVVDGHAFVVLVDPAYRLRVLRLARDLRTERERTLPLASSYDNPQARLHNLDGHLVLDLPLAPDLVDLPLDLDLSRITHRPRPAPPPDFPGGGGEVCSPSLRLASELLAICNCGNQTCLSWAPLPP